MIWIVSIKIIKYVKLKNMSRICTENNIKITHNSRFFSKAIVMNWIHIQYKIDD